MVCHWLNVWNCNFAIKNLNSSSHVWKFSLKTTSQFWIQLACPVYMWVCLKALNWCNQSTTDHHRWLMDLWGLAPIALRMVKIVHSKEMAKFRIGLLKSSAICFRLRHILNNFSSGPVVHCKFWFQYYHFNICINETSQPTFSFKVKNLLMAFKKTNNNFLFNHWMVETTKYLQM